MTQSGFPVTKSKAYSNFHNRGKSSTEVELSKLKNFLKQEEMKKRNLVSNMETKRNSTYS